MQITCWTLSDRGGVIVTLFGRYTNKWELPQKVVSTSVSIKGSKVCA